MCVMSLLEWVVIILLGVCGCIVVFIVVAPVVATFDTCMKDALTGSARQVCQDTYHHLANAKP